MTLTYLKENLDMNTANYKLLLTILVEINNFGIGKLPERQNEEIEITRKNIGEEKTLKSKKRENQVLFYIFKKLQLFKQ